MPCVRSLLSVTHFFGSGTNGNLNAFLMSINSASIVTHFFGSGTNGNLGLWRLTVLCGPRVTHFFGSGTNGNTISKAFTDVPIDWSRTSSEVELMETLRDRRQSSWLGRVTHFFGSGTNGNVRAKGTAIMESASHALLRKWN